jgi:hypothetical protein
MLETPFHVYQYGNLRAEEGATSMPHHQLLKVVEYDGGVLDEVPVLNDYLRLR